MLAGHVHDLAVLVDFTHPTREAEDDTEVSVYIVERLVIGVQVVRRELIEGGSIHVCVCVIRFRLGEGFGCPFRDLR